MKKLIPILSVCLVLGSCTYRLEPIEPENYTLTFTANMPEEDIIEFDENGTKTTMEEETVDGKTKGVQKWEAGDKIKVFTADYPGGIYSDPLPANPDPKTVQFTVSFGNTPPRGPFYATYGVPEGTELRVNEGTFNFEINLPAEQIYHEGKAFIQNENPMTAKCNSEDPNHMGFDFFNICGMLKIKVQNDKDITGIEIKDLRTDTDADELTSQGYLSGRFNVVFNQDAVPHLERINGSRGGSGSRNKTIKFENGKKLSAVTGTNVNFFYVMAPAGSFSKGFKVTWKEGSEYATTTVTPKAGKESALAVSQNTIKAINVGKPKGTDTKKASLKSANSFILPAKDGIFSIPVEYKGNGAQGNKSGADKRSEYEDGIDLEYGEKSFTISDGQNAEIIWQTRNDDSFITSAEIVTLQGYDNNKKEISFHLTGVEGNALVALKDANGDILWSWHLWIVNPELLVETEIKEIIDGKETIKAVTYDFNTAYQIIDYNGYTFIDRNIGALSSEENNVLTYGMTYQYGRKDPFPGAKKINISGGDESSASIYPIDALTSSSYFENFENSIKLPNSYAVSYGKSWINTNKISKYGWDEYKKNIFDPCPVGWRFSGAEKLDLESGTYEGKFRNDHFILTEKFHIPLTGYYQDSHWVDNQGTRTISSVSQNVYYYKSKIYSLAAVGFDDYFYGNVEVFSFSKQETMVFTTIKVSNCYGVPVRCQKWEEPEISKPTTENNGNLSSYPSGN